MDDSEARAVLAAHGIPAPSRGRLRPDLRDQADELAKAGGGPEYDGGITEADFPPDDSPPAELGGELGGELGAAPGAEPASGERRPRRVRQAGPGIRGRITGTPPPKSRSKAKGKKQEHPRVPVDGLIERTWEMLARMAMPVSPPVARCMAFQAPVAGLVLEDAVRGTFIDRGLQPVARAEDRAEKVVALIGPPMIVGALQAAQGLPDDQRMMREAILLPMLRETLAMQVRVAGDKIDRVMARNAERGPVYEQVDAMIKAIFEPLVPPPGAGDLEADEVARAQSMAGV